MNPEDVALPAHYSILVPFGSSLADNHRVETEMAIHRPAAIGEGSLSVEYRKLLRWYPAEWRAANEDAMIGVLLDQADHELRSTPTRAEKTGLFRAGIAQRIGFPQRGRRLRLIPLSAAAALSVFYALFIIWAPNTAYLGSLGPFSNPSVVTCLLFVMALFAGLFLRGKAASTLALTAVGVEIAIGILSSANHWQGPGWTAVALFAGLGILSGTSLREGWSFVIGALLVTAIAAATIIVSWVTAGLGQFTLLSLIVTITAAPLTLLAIALLFRRLRLGRPEPKAKPTPRT